MPSAETKSFVYYSDDMQRLGICTFGFKGFPCALVTFINNEGGEYKDHPVRPFLQQTVGMKHAEHFAKTGEVAGEGERLTV